LAQTVEVRVELSADGLAGTLQEHSVMPLGLEA
jgi:hypothetical protein